MSASPFAYERPETLAAALTALAAPGSVPIGGGTDLLTCIEEGIAAPARVLDVRHLPGMREIHSLADGSLRIGAGVLLDTLAHDPTVRAHFPLLGDAAASVGTPALRNMGTIGGNLMQRPRCWYLRRNVPCFKNGGAGCPAVPGEHEHHGIVAEGTCRAVHPSDPAVALLALDAHIEVAVASGLKRTFDIATLYEGAASNPTADTTLAADELITAIILPAAAAGGDQHWEKLMQRGAWDFALVSCAAARRTDGGVRMALGGIALAPWRVPLSIEEDVASGGLDPESLDALAERAMYDTAPLERNAHKVTMAQALLRRAMRALSATAKPITPRGP